MKILVLGSSGLLGSTLVPILESFEHEVITHSRKSNTNYRVDLSNRDATRAFLDSSKADVIVNLVGMTDVDHCESDSNLAYRSNVKTVSNIAKWIEQGDPQTHLIHISTDQVYDRVNLNEEEQVVLRNYYAFSKFAGELAASRVASTILRTNFFGRSKCPDRSSISDWVYKELTTGNPIQVVDDITFSPLSMTTVSHMIELVIRQKPTGVFNLGSHSGMSKADFAFYFANELNLSTGTMMRVSIDDCDFFKGRRPTGMRMNCSKFEKVSGITLPSLRTEIERVAQEYD
jgi:dTDP-4-dehydrorhamnose reductase